MTHPAVQDAREALALEQQARDHHDQRFYRALMVSPTLSVCQALLRGEHVPTSALDPVWLARFGIRQQRRAA